MKSKLLIILLSSMSFFSMNSYSAAPETFNDLDCTEEEIMNYASKDNFKEPNGISIMPSVEEFKPAQFNKDLTEKGSEEMGCPSFSADVNWQEIQEAYEDLVDGLKDAMAAIEALLSSDISIGDLLQEQLDKARENLKKGVCERITSATKTIMWDLIDAKYGAELDIYTESNQTIIQRLIKETNLDSNQELMDVYKQVGAKKKGQSMKDFVIEAGMADAASEMGDFTDSIEDSMNDSIEDELENISNELFGN